MERIHHVKCNELREGDVLVRRVAPDRGCMSFDSMRPAAPGSASAAAPAGSASAGQHSGRGSMRRKAKSGKRHASDGDLASMARRSADSVPMAAAELPVSQPAADGKPPLAAKPRRRTHGKGQPPPTAAAAAPTSQPLQGDVVPVAESPFNTTSEPPGDSANGAAAAERSPDATALESHKVSVSSSISGGDGSEREAFEDAVSTRPGLLERITQSQYGAEERAQLETSAARVSEFVAARQVGYERRDELTVPLGAPPLCFGRLATVRGSQASSRAPAGDRGSRQLQSGGVGALASVETTATSKPTADPMAATATDARSALPRVSAEGSASTPRVTGALGLPHASAPTCCQIFNQH